VEEARDQASIWWAVGFVEAAYEGENHSVKPVNGFGFDAESQKARGKDI